MLKPFKERVAHMVINTTQQVLAATGKRAFDKKVEGSLLGTITNLAISRSINMF